MFLETIGWTADILFLVAYFLVSQGKVSGEGKPYNFMNLGGAILFGTYAIFKSAWPIFVLEIFWGGIAAFALWKVFSRTNKLSEES